MNQARVHKQESLAQASLAEAYDQLSQTSRYRRFFTGKPHLSEQSLAYFTDVDHRGHEALVVVVPGSGQLVGVAGYIRIPGQRDQAEVAITVLDSWQRRGLGTVLLRAGAAGRGGGHPVLRRGDPGREPAHGYLGAAARGR